MNCIYRANKKRNEYIAKKLNDLKENESVFLLWLKATGPELADIRLFHRPTALDEISLVERLRSQAREKVCPRVSAAGEKRPSLTSAV